MAKAGKKAEPAAKVPVPIVLPKPTPVGKAAPAGKKAAAPPPPPPPPPAKTTVRKGTVKVTVETSPAEAKVLPAVSMPAPTTPAAVAPPPALTEVVRLADDLKQTLGLAAAELASVRSEALQARAELRAMRAEREAIGKELDELREQARAARDEAAAGLGKVKAAGAEAAAALDRVRAEAAAAVAPLADLKHLCRETGEKLVQEFGEQSVAVTKVRQLREQVDEVVESTTASADRIKGFREECERAGQQAETLHLKAREAYLSSLAEVLAGLERVKTEAAVARERVAAAAAAPPPPEPVEAEALATTAATTTADEHEDDADEPADGGNRLGLTVTEGAVVEEVEAGSLAAELGLARGDVIEAVDGSAVHTGPKLRAALARAVGGGGATLRFRRGDDTQEVVARFSGGEDDHLGASVAGGVVVAEVRPGSPAAAAGVEEGDVILTANGRPVAEGAELREVVTALAAGADLELALTRGGEAREVTARLGATS